MPAASAIVYECPGCGKIIEPGEDYVIAREYESPTDFVLHVHHDEYPRASRRFHVAHFRRQIGECVYELVHEEGSDGADAPAVR